MRLFRWAGLAIALSVVSLGLMLLSLHILHSNSESLKKIATQNCRNIEELKAVQVKVSNAGIDADLAFLQAHPNGTSGSPRAYVLARIVRRQYVVNQFAAKPCP
jgi:hypothetical protein